MATLADLARQYLNQRLPDISGIFTLPQASGIMGSTITTPNVVPVQGLTPEQLALLYPQNQGGGDEPRTGFGLFDNLDQNDVRYEVVNGELVPTYRNVTSGLYQTEKGKNISNLGLSTPTSSFLDGIFGAKKPPQFPGYFQQDPETRGKFIDYITGRTRRNKVEAFKAGKGGDAVEQARQSARDQARINRAYREETGGQGGSYATGESGVQSDGSYNDPFDPGGGE